MTLTGAQVRTGAAAAVAGIVGSGLLLTGRFPGTAATVLLLVASSRAAAALTALGGGPVGGAMALRSLSRQAQFAPALVLVVAAGVVRAGSTSLADIRGANAVAGLAVFNGNALTVAGAWCALAAGIIAAAGPGAGRCETASPPGRRGVVSADPLAQRLEALALVANAGLLATLFAGPQATRALDALPWVFSFAAIGAAVWFGAQRAAHPRSPVVALGVAAAGLLLTLAGGAP